MGLRLFPILLAAAGAFLLVLPALATEETIKALKNCAKESGLSIQTLQKGCDHEMPAGDLPAYKCFTKCVQQQVGIMDADGGINPVASAALVPEPERPKMTEIANQCVGTATKDLCEKGYTVDKCYHDKDNEMYKRNCMALIQTMAG